MQLQNNIKLDNLEYTGKRREYWNFSRNSLPIILRDIRSGNLSLKDTDKVQI